MVGIFTLSSFSTLPQPPVRGIDKPEHYIEYGGLAVVAIWALLNSRKRRSLLTAAVMGVAIASLYGITDEFHQSFVPNRSCDILDWVCDTLGAITGALFMISIIRLKRKLRHKKSEGGDINGI